MQAGYGEAGDLKRLCYPEPNRRLVFNINFVSKVAGLLVSYIYRH